MKPVKIVILGLSIAAATAAYMWADGMLARQKKVVVVEKPQSGTEMVEVLVASKDISIGDKLTDAQVKWAAWPREAASGQFMVRSQGQATAQTIAGTIARSSFVMGEPIIKGKIVDANGSGFLSAILPAGKRASSVQISAEIGAGGFILPNDHVDVVLTRRANNGAASETILKNIRVLAIDQKIEEKNGQKAVVGTTATLELLPEQVETLTVAKLSGSLALALRSLADVKNTQTEDEQTASSDRSSTTIVRFGVTQQISGR